MRCRLKLIGSQGTHASLSLFSETELMPLVTHWFVITFLVGSTAFPINLLPLNLYLLYQTDGWVDM